MRTADRRDMTIVHHPLLQMVTCTDFGAQLLVRSTITTGTHIDQGVKTRAAIAIDLVEAIAVAMIVLTSSISRAATLLPLRLPQTTPLLEEAPGHSNQVVGAATEDAPRIRAVVEAAVAVAVVGGRPNVPVNVSFYAQNESQRQSKCRA